MPPKLPQDITPGHNFRSNPIRARIRNGRPTDYEREFWPLDDPRLQEGVDEEGEAVISRWWSVWFFEGTRDQQEARLKELRLDPKFQKPCSDDEIPVRFEGGARCDDVYLTVQEEEQNEKLKPVSTS